MANSISNKQKPNTSVQGLAGKILHLGRLAAGKLSVAGGKVSALFRRAGKGKSRPAAARSRSAFNRRSPVRRAEVSRLTARRTEEPSRYLLGIEAAEMFELDVREREAAQQFSGAAEPQENRPRGFFYRHRKGLIAACLVFAMLLGGVRYMLSLYTKEDIFISDEAQAGNITISDRLTMSEEHADKVKYILILGVDDSSLLTDCIWIMCFDNEA